MTGSRSVGELARTAFLMFGARLAVAEGFGLGARALPRAGSSRGDELGGALGASLNPPAQDGSRLVASDTAEVRPIQAFPR